MRLTCAATLPIGLKSGFGLQNFGGQIIGFVHVILVLSNFQPNTDKYAVYSIHYCV